MANPTSLAAMRAVSDDAVVVADERGCIIEVNAAFERLFGWTAAEIIGRSLTAIMPPDLRDAHNIGFSRFVMTRQTRVLNHPIRVQAMTKAGEVFDAEHLIVGENSAEGWVFAARIRA